MKKTPPQSNNNSSTKPKMQRSTFVFTFILILTLCLGYYRFAFSPSAPPSAPLDDLLSMPPGESPSDDEKGKNTDDSSSTSSPTTSSSSSSTPSTKRFNPKNLDQKGSHKEDEADHGAGETDPPVDNTGESSSYSGPAIPPSPAGCIDVTHEETTNQVELTNRMNAFRPSSKLSKKLWGSDTPVFPESTTEIPPVMKQWLFCYTKNYVGDYENSVNKDCTAELVDNDPTPVQSGKFFLGVNSRYDNHFLNKCTISPVYQGNVTEWAALSPIYTQFPGPLKEKERLLSSISSSRPWYWKNVPDPFSLSCPTCRETKDLLHPSFLVGTRRWWSVQKWLIMTRPVSSSSTSNTNSRLNSATDYTVETAPYSCFTIMENSFRTIKRAGLQGMCDGTAQPEPGEVLKWPVDLKFSDIVDITFNFHAFDAFFSITFYNKQKNVLETHVISPMLGEPGVFSFWTSLQMLFGQDIPRQPERRSLFPTISKNPPFFARNITDHYVKLQCKINHLGISLPKGTKITQNYLTYDICWRDLISVSSPKIPAWNPANLKFPSSSGDEKQQQQKQQDGTIFSTTVQPTEHFRYLPCHPPYMTALVNEARSKDNMDSHGLYWPFSCKRIGNRRPCLDDLLSKMIRLKSQKKAPSSAADWKALPPKNKLRMSDLVKPKVAVCLAGFARSFHLSRLSIFQNLVDPFDSDFFASTWNVQGRVKKTDPVLKTHVISTQRMKMRIYNGIPKDRNLTELFDSGRYAIHVFGYRLWEQYMKDVRVAGFRHAGLYMLLAKSLKMMTEQAERTGSPYDVVIRGRFDLVPLVPIMIYPVWNTPDVERRTNLNVETENQQQQDQQQQQQSPQKSSSSGALTYNSKVDRVPGWIIDTGSSCEMDNFWWPRTAVLREGVVISHTADTRFKLFSWQYCDWLHIGTYNTMKRMAGLYDWVLDNYVDSGAQFVEHVWAIDEGVRFYPMQLYLKILRETIKKPKKNGKRVKRIRMHLFG